MKFVSCSLDLLATFAASTCAAWNVDLANAKFVANALDEGKNLHALGLRGAANSKTSALGDIEEEMDEEHDVPSLEGAIATADLNFIADAVDREVNTLTVGDMGEDMEEDREIGGALDIVSMDIVIPTGDQNAVAITNAAVTAALFIPVLLESTVTLNFWRSTR
jgi:hypothetical protein